MKKMKYWYFKKSFNFNFNPNQFNIELSLNCPYSNSKFKKFITFDATYNEKVNSIQNKLLIFFFSLWLLLIIINKMESFELNNVIKKKSLRDIIVF